MKNLTRRLTPADAGRVQAALLLFWAATSLAPAARLELQKPPADQLELFKTWLDGTHPGYGCDEGPALFKNPTVEAAYPGRRFYYVLTHARGIAPPYKNSLSLVVSIDESGNIEPINHSFPANYRTGLIKVTRGEEARLATAAALVLALGDPGERRWKVDPDKVVAKKKKKEWICTYEHGDAGHTSIVTFDKNGLLAALSCNPPPVP